MGKLWIPIIIALIASIPGILASLSSMRQNQRNREFQEAQARANEDIESRKVDAEALERAKRFYSSLIDEMEETLKAVREELIQTRAELHVERQERLRLAVQLQKTLDVLRRMRTALESAGLTVPIPHDLDLSI